jgi:hypothetical protein
MGVARNGKPEGKRPLERPRLRWAILMKYGVSEGVECIHLLGIGTSGGLLWARILVSRTELKPFRHHIFVFQSDVVRKTLPL